MNLSELLEDGGKDLVIIYPGRFHPFHIGHGKVYKYLKQKYSNAKVFISTSGKVDGDRSPFTFEEKRKMMILAGVSASDIVQTKSPYQSIEIMERFDKDKTVVVFAVSEKDMAEDPRFDFSNGLKLKKNGEPAYLQKWNNLNDAETFATRGYIATTPTFKFKVRGQEINSASQIRNMIAQSDDTKLTQMLQDLYSITDVPDDIIEIFKRKVGNKETMNENWDEHSFYKFLQESINEENTMKDGILQTLTEGKSPHKKGTKKYNAHMAAMHAESYDEEFDSKVKQVVESKLKNVAADIKDYVDDHKEHFDAYPMDVEVNGKVYDFDDYWKILDLVYPDSYDNKYAVEGKEQLEEAFVLAPWILPALATAVRIGAPALKLLLKGGKKAAPKVKDTTTNMIQKSTASGVIVGAVGKTVYDKVGDAIDGIKNIFGIDMDEDTLNIFAQIVVKYGIPMAAIGAVLYGGKQLKDYMTGEEEKQTGNTTINNYYNGEPAKEAYNENYANDQHEKLEYIHHVLQECGDGNMDITMVEQALEYVEDIREQHFNADGSTKSESVNESNDHDIKLLKAVARQMASDAQKGDYTAIDELLQDVSEEELKAFLSDHRSPDEVEYFQRVNEAQVLAHGGKGQYKAVSDGGVVRIMHKGKEIASGDFDSGADGWFVSREDDKGQKFFSNAQDMVDFFAEQKVTEWVQDSPAQGFSGQERNFIQELCLRMDGVSKSPEGLKWMGKSKTWDEGNVLSDKGKLTTVMLWAKRNLDDLYDRMGSEFKVYSDGNDKGESGRGQSDGNQIIQNIIKKIGTVNEDWEDVTPKGYGPDDYDEKDVAPEDHGGDLKKMQDTYKYNEDRNNHSENILMLAQAFGDRGEIRAVEGLLKIIKRQGYTTPEQSDMMYKAIHKKYYSQLFPAENEGNEFSGELAKAKIDGKKEFKVDGKTYKVKEALSKLLDSQKTNEAGIMHYSDAKGTSEYKEGQKAAKNGEPYDSNPYSGAEKLKWSKGHNEWRHANKRKKGKPNFGARGQFE